LHGGAQMQDPFGGHAAAPPPWRLRSSEKSLVFNVEDKNLPHFTLLRPIAASEWGVDAGNDRLPGPGVGEEHPPVV
jgi:hypothetical protein